MALHFETPADFLSRDVTFLDPALDWTLLFWNRIPVTNPGGYRALRFLGTSGFGSDPYLYYGTINAGTDDLEVEVYDGSSFVDSIPLTLTVGSWVCTALVYTAATTALVWYRNNVLIDTLTVDLSAVSPFTFDGLPADGSGDTTADDVAYERMWQAALTPAQLLLESRSPSAVRTTNLLSDCPLVVPQNTTDQSGNGHDWNLNGTSTYTDGPLTPNVFPTKGHLPQSDAISGPKSAKLSAVASDRTGDREASQPYARYWQRHDDLISNAAQVSGPTAAGHVAIWTGDKQLADGGALGQGVTPFDLSLALDGLP